MIQIKNAKELDGMRKANALSAAALKYGGEHIEAGMTTWELDKLIYCCLFHCHYTFLPIS